MESDQSLEGQLTVAKVSEAIRILGATFFNEMTGAKKQVKNKVYESTTLVAEEDYDDEAHLAAPDEM